MVGQAAIAGHAEQRPAVDAPRQLRAELGELLELALGWAGDVLELRAIVVLQRKGEQLALRIRIRRPPGRLVDDLRYLLGLRLRRVGNSGRGRGSGSRPLGAASQVRVAAGRATAQAWTRACPAPARQSRGWPGTGMTISNRRTSSPRSQRARELARTPRRYRAPGRFTSFTDRSGPHPPERCSGPSQAGGPGCPGPPQPRRICVASGLAAVFVVLAIDGFVRSLDYLLFAPRETRSEVTCSRHWPALHRYPRSGSD